MVKKGPELTLKSKCTHHHHPTTFQHQCNGQNTRKATRSDVMLYPNKQPTIITPLPPHQTPPKELSKGLQKGHSNLLFLNSESQGLKVQSYQGPKVPSSQAPMLQIS